MRIESETELNKLIKAQNMPNFWLFFGDEELLKSRYVKTLVSKNLTDEAKQVDLSPFDAPFLVMDELIGCLQSFPLMSAHRVAVLTGLAPDTLTSEDFETLVAVIQDLSPSSILIISAADGVTEKQPRMKKMTSIAEKKGAAVYLTARKKSDLVRFVKSELAKYNADAENFVCYKIIDFCRQDMQQIENECAKLGAYASGGMVTQDDAEFFINLPFEESVFDLVRCLIGKNNQIAVKKLNILLENGTKPLEAITAIISVYSDLQKAAVAQKNGISLPQATADFGYNEKKQTFRLERAWNQTNRLRSGYAFECLTLALDADRYCKSKKADYETVLVKLVADLCSVPA
ncbi:MAG TPA: DNA polymerase III subunit delta [Oscillospiraceae bacterium]|nr:DNA polymerase III subunit delta [Oscillospiraceae bacterium]